LKIQKQFIKQTIKIAFLLFIIFSIKEKSYAQIGISSYNFDVIAVNFDLIKTDNSSLVVEIKQFAKYDNWGDTKGDTSTELDLHYKFKKREYHRFSIGVGFKGELFHESGENNVIFPLGLEVFPIPNFKKISLQYECAPGISTTGENLSLRNLIGIRYSFGS